MRWLIVILLVCWSGISTAHPLAPALLDIQQKDEQNYELLWRLSAMQMRGVAPQPVLPAVCETSSDINLQREIGLAVASRWQMRCDVADLTGQTIAFEGLDRNPINVVLRLKYLDGSQVQTLLDADQPGFTVPARENSSQVFYRYLALGVEHLVLGPDHLLFLLALILLVGMQRKLIWTLTAFTLGHSITLSLASLDILKVNAALMELGIAISLVIAAREVLGHGRSWLGKHPASMAAAFGLLHGLGFAGALADIGLPQNDLVPALLAFNIGIELAQIAIAASLFLGLLAWNRIVSGRQPLNLNPVSAYVIGTLAAMWCIERSFAVLI